MSGWTSSPVEPWQVIERSSTSCLSGFEADWKLGSAFALASIVVMYVFICFMNIWHAGWSIGPRYLAFAVPFLGWASLVALDALHA